MAKIKTIKIDGEVSAFLESVKEEEKRKDCMVLLAMLKKITKQEPKIWSNGVIGFGTYHYKSERSKQEGDWFMTGFSPRKQYLTIYIIPGFSAYGGLMKKLGKYKTTVSCLNINKLADIDVNVLKELIATAFKQMKEKYGK